MCIFNVDDWDDGVVDPVENDRINADGDRVTGEDLLRLDTERDQSQVHNVKGIYEWN